MANREAYKQKVRAQLDEWKADVDKLRAQIKQKQADRKIDTSKYMDEIRKNQKRVRAKLEELEDAGEDAWDDIKSGLDKATDELKQSYAKAKSKFN
ncbi:hypothetical protein [Rhodohalobacter sp. 614A]|uniref:hypothetical protein n=1 Tax=Rhodohalobacter sp. 614A TaxID=2908649 RepID=UPI001F3318BF|nr:hypothetical protein [Rhodohalobacter sp. 614A]